MIDVVIAIVAVAAISLVLMVVWPFLVISGRISEEEDRQEILSRLGRAQNAAAGSSEHIEDNR